SPVTCSPAPARWRKSRRAWSNAISKSAIKRVSYARRAGRASSCRGEAEGSISRHSTGNSNPYRIANLADSPYQLAAIVRGCVAQGKGGIYDDENRGYGLRLS